MKILITNNYGAGWSTWYDYVDGQNFMLTYQPFIDHLETLEKNNTPNDLDENHPLAQQFIFDFKCMFPGKSLPYLGALPHLRVKEISLTNSLVEQIGIGCHDGKEYIK